MNPTSAASATAQDVEAEFDVNARYNNGHTSIMVWRVTEVSRLETFVKGYVKLTAEENDLTYTFVRNPGTDVQAPSFEIEYTESDHDV